MLTAVVRMLTSAREDEVAPTLWATGYGFCIMFAYYILRAVRDEISTTNQGNLQILFSAVFLVMLVVVPAYSWLGSRLSRAVFVPIANRFLITNLVAFYAALMLLPAGARVWIDRVFYVWASMFALFVVTVFWGFMADLFRNEQGKRLFGFIAVGSTLGGIAGSAVTASMVQHLPHFTLLLVACVPLEVASWCVGVLHRRFGGGTDPARPENRPLGGSAWSGIGMIFRSPYLLAIVSYIALMTFSSTVLYFQQAHVVGLAISDRAARTALLARIDLWANVFTILLQAYVVERIIRWVGVGVSLAVLPVLTCIGFLGLSAFPVLPALVAFQVAYRAVRYGLAKPSREILFTVVSREEKYKSKAFIDAAIYRGGDVASGWIYAGLSALGLTVAAIALLAAPMAAIWAIVATRLGRRQEERAKTWTPEGTAAGTAPA
jgi:ATP:ADP antiporter, AAA family